MQRFKSCIFSRVAEPCKEIYDDKSKVYEYTMKGNMVAVVTDGTAVLGLVTLDLKHLFQ